MNETEVEEFDAEDKSIKDILFSNYTYRVPPYQRPYTWGDDQVADFWTDLTTNAGAYFLGSFIFNYQYEKKERIIEIIDGQQRLLTITLLMAAIRDTFRELGEHSNAKLIQTHNISFEDGRGRMTNRVLCGDTTYEFFSIIQDFENRLDTLSVETKEHKLIKKNYTFFKEKIKEGLKTCPTKSDKIDYLFDLRDKVGELKVIWIKIKSEDGAYEIFETVNARGIELSVADLLKNLIFKKISETNKDQNKIKQKWAQIQDNIHTTDSDLKRFFRYYWLSKKAFVTEKKLFKNIKNEIVDYPIFLDDLLESSQLYNQLVEVDIEDWEEIDGGNHIHQSLDALRLMEVSQCYVLLMSILRNYKKLNTNPRRIFELIENFTFQYSIICGMPANRVEKIYSKYAIKIETAVKEHPNQKRISASIQSIFSELQKELNSIRPKRDEFISNFQELSYGRSEYKRKIIKYILSKINSKYSSGEYRIDFDVVNTEHILPQKPGKDWGLKRSDISDYVDKLGNLTIVHKKINSSIGNRNLKDKVEGLSKSDLMINKKLIEEIKTRNFKWDEKIISERHRKMAETAYDVVWRL